MSAYALESPNEKAISGALALVMHGLFLALLIFGVNWKKPEPVAMVAELWSTLPSPKSEYPPPQPPKVEPEPPKPQPKVEVKPAPRVEPKPEPKAEINLREKKEKERKAREQELAEKKKRQELEKAEAAKLQQAKEAGQAKRLAQEQAEALKKLAQQQAAAQSKMVDDYIFKIQAKIKARMNKASCVSLGNPEIQLRIILLPDGNVLGEPEIRQSSGASPCDTAAMRAAILAQPLPVPSDRELFHSKFRDFNLRFRPNE